MARRLLPIIGRWLWPRSDQVSGRDEPQLPRLTVSRLLLLAGLAVVLLVPEEAFARVPGFGKVFYPSDAATVTCWSRTTGLTCKHYNGVSFWIGRTRGYRIFYDAPGFVPHVRPLFRTSFGVRCGIELDNLEPANPVLLCWHPSDGLQLTIAHDRAGYGGQHSRAERRPRATCRRGSRYSEAAGRSVGVAAR
jgi:hypothetical protein